VWGRPKRQEPGDPNNVQPGTLVVVVRHRRGEQLAVTETACWGPERWSFVRRWTKEGRWTKRSAQRRLIRVATEEDIVRFNAPPEPPDDLKF
jgi:hypothetical protein